MKPRYLDTAEIRQGTSSITGLAAITTTWHEGGGLIALTTRPDERAFHTGLAEATFGSFTTEIVITDVIHSNHTGLTRVQFRGHSSTPLFLR